MLKYKRIRKEICEILRRHYNLGLTFMEVILVFAFIFFEQGDSYFKILIQAYKEKVFVREAFKRYNSKEFFALVKENNVEKVHLMLFSDKYLVHDYDNVIV